MKTLGILCLTTLLLLPVAFGQPDTRHACGAVSLYHLATLFGIEVALDKTDTALRETHEGGRVASFAELITCAKKIGLELQGVRLTYTQLQALRTPVITHLKTTFEDQNPSAAEGSVGHFIVIEHATDQWVRLFDRPRNSLREAATVVSRDRFLALWTGKTLVLSEKTQRRLPALVASPTLFDFGDGAAEEYGIPVQLKNVSGMPLKINSIAANCNCTVAQQQTSLIPPGGYTYLDVSWDASAQNRSLFTTLHIETDARERPHTFVSLGLKREFSLVFIPQTISLSGTSTAGLKRSLELQNLNETRAKILKMVPSQEWIHPVLHSDAIIPPWQHAEIELHFETEQMPKDKRVDETLTVHYEESGGKRKTIRLPISGTVNQRWTLTPKRFFFGRIKANTEHTKAVLLRMPSDSVLQIQNVETDVGTAQVEQLTDEHRYKVRLTLPPLLPTGILKSEVRIHTTHPKAKLIKVPVFALVIE